MIPVSGVVICMNEERNIERCLRSLELCDEIVVVDSGSTDRTREIAARFTDRVVVHDFEGYVEQKNHALDLAKHDWVLSLDADECLSEDLASEIRARLADEPEHVAGFELDRVTWYLGVWHRLGEWHPDWQLRLFRRSRGRFAGRDPHDRVELDGAVRRLRGRLEHRTYRDLAEHIRTVDRFSASRAEVMWRAGDPFRLLDLIGRPIVRFFRGWLLRGGFRLGVPGFLVSVSTAYYVFMKYAKLWELYRERGEFDDREERGDRQKPDECAEAGQRGRSDP